MRSTSTFVVYRGVNSESCIELATLPQNTTTFIDTTAKGNDGITTYSYSVKACNIYGCSPATTAAVVPYKPTNLKRSVLGGTINLTWNDISTNETGFQIQRKSGACTSTNAWSLIETTGANATAYSNTGLQAGAYSYRIRSFTKSSAAPYSHGYSGWSNCVSGVVQ